MRIAWFTDTGDSLTGYTSRLLLPELSIDNQIDVYTTGSNNFLNFPTYNYLSSFLRHDKENYDIFFYNFEDLSSSNFIRIHLGLIPGIVWFHNFILKSFGPEPILNSPWETVLQKYFNPDLPWLIPGAEYQQRGPQAVRETSYAAVPLFSNPVNAVDFNKHLNLSLNDKSACYVPIPVDDDAFDIYPEGVCTLAYSGTPTIEARSHVLLEALSQSKYKLLWMLSLSEKEKAQELLEEFGVKNYQLIVGRTDKNWKEIISKSSMAFHGLFSVFDNFSFDFPISMAAGIPIILSDFGQSDYIPDDLVFKVRPGASELSEVITLLQELGFYSFNVQRQKEFAREFYDKRLVAGNLSTVFNKNFSFSNKLLLDWNKYIEAAGLSLTKNLLDQKDFLSPVYKELNWI